VQRYNFISICKIRCKTKYWRYLLWSRRASEKEERGQRQRRANDAVRGLKNILGWSVAMLV